MSNKQESSVIIVPEGRQPYELIRPLIQAGVELKPGDRAQLTKAQADRLREQGVIA